ncbi:hypothetical protein SAMN05192533_102298 [Mesobacillus persicus]|uniref:Uncharacterized protein n=1 Tax=Mesobacillus persicus TaxID=930146 RepID=A0A1H7XP37_9BACI|nr:hypothetical protein [Mesobacillus persicus]SEM35501.1 hypothetical protein SAMN05192533_102298 [Mesobacillus persicus]
MYYISVVNDVTGEEMEHLSLINEKDAGVLFKDAVFSLIESPGKFHVYLKDRVGDLCEYKRVGLDW